MMWNVYYTNETQESEFSSLFVDEYYGETVEGAIMEFKDHRKNHYGRIVKVEPVEYYE